MDLEATSRALEKQGSARWGQLDMAEKQVFKVSQAPTSGKWMVTAGDKETPVLFVDSKDEAADAAKEMANNLGGEVEVEAQQTTKQAKQRAKAPRKKSKKAA